MSKKRRWILAQSYEKDWWEKRIDLIDFDFHYNHANDLKQFILPHFRIKENIKILEIGSGAGGTITFLSESNNRFAADPLEKFYSSVEKFRKQRDKNVDYQAAIGEYLSFKNDFFDLIIIDNVLDHCADPSKVMQELKRVSKPESFIYFRQNTYHIWGRFIRAIMEFFTIDKGHPFTFSKNQIFELIKDYEFEIIKNSSSGYVKIWKREFFSSSLKDKIKSFILVTRNSRTFLLKNR